MNKFEIGKPFDEDLYARLNEIYDEITYYETDTPEAFRAASDELFDYVADVATGALDDDNVFERYKEFWNIERLTKLEAIANGNDRSESARKIRADLLMLAVGWIDVYNSVTELERIMKDIECQEDHEDSSEE